MKEMKFLLVETPSKDSVWLHLDTSGRAGLSLWRTGILRHIEHPTLWLAPYLWLVKFKPAVVTKPTKGLLNLLVPLAFEDACCAICLKDHAMLAQSMCTIYGYQFISGAPNATFTVKGTLGRCLAVEHHTQEPYLIGITRKPITKAVLQ